MDSVVLLSILSGFLGLILGALGLIIGCIALSKAVGIEKSTHTVQMMPVDPEIDAHNKKIMEQWATKEEAIAKQEKLFKEELEDKMPEFYPEDEDKEVFSI